MKSIAEYTDDRNKSWCIHCGGYLSDLECNRDHVPTKGFLLEPYPAELPVIKVCRSCNFGFSLDEQYFIAFLGAVTTGSTDPNKQRNTSAANALKNEKLRSTIEKSKINHLSAEGDPQLIWQPEFERIKRVILKNARGHIFYEYGEPLLEEPRLVRFNPLCTMTDEQLNTFYTPSSDFTVWPEVGSRMMTRLVSGDDLDSSWIVVQDRTYQYTFAQDNGVIVRSIIWDYLATEVAWQ